MRLRKYDGKEGEGEFRAMTLIEAKALRSGQHVWFRSNQGDARRAKVNGQPKTWKRDIRRVSVSLKYGLHDYAQYTERDMDRLLVEEGPPKDHGLVFPPHPPDLEPTHYEEAMARKTGATVEQLRKETRMAELYARYRQLTEEMWEAVQPTDEEVKGLKEDMSFNPEVYTSYLEDDRMWLAMSVWEEREVQREYNEEESGQAASEQKNG